MYRGLSGSQHSSPSVTASRPNPAPESVEQDPFLEGIMNESPSTPVPSKDRIEMPRRPQTLGYESAQIVDVTADQIRAMSDEELRNLCTLAGIAAKPGWKRSRLLNALVTASVSAQDY